MLKKASSLVWKKLPKSKKEREARAYAEAVQKACDEAREAVRELDVFSMSYTIPQEFEELDPEALIESCVGGKNPDEIYAQSLDHLIDKLGEDAKASIERERAERHEHLFMTMPADLEYIEGLIKNLEELEAAAGKK